MTASSESCYTFFPIPSCICGGWSSSYAKPRQRRHLVVQSQRSVAAADDVALLRFVRMFAQEGQQVPGKSFRHLPSDQRENMFF
jgi:hypothetical protein